MMKALRAIPLMLVILASLAACGTGGATPTGAPVAAATNTPVVLPTAAQPANPCENQYFPAKLNTRWTYASTGSSAGVYEFTEQVSDVQPDGFTVSSQLKKQPAKQVWSCRPEGLVPTTMILDNVTSILAFQKLTDVKANSETGAVIPAKLTPGSQWNYTIELEGVQKIQKATGVVLTVDIQTGYSAGNQESVTVPAGTYDAIPVTAQTMIKFSAPGKSTVIVKSQYTYWYAAGVGWVKATGNGKIGGETFFETIVLTAFSNQ